MHRDAVVLMKDGQGVPKVRRDAVVVKEGLRLVVQAQGERAEQCVATVVLKEGLEVVRLQSRRSDVQAFVAHVAAAVESRRAVPTHLLG